MYEINCNASRSGAIALGEREVPLTVEAFLAWDDETRAMAGEAPPYDGLPTKPAPSISRRADRRRDEIAEIRSLLLELLDTPVELRDVRQLSDLDPTFIGDAARIDLITAIEQQQAHLAALRAEALAALAHDDGTEDGRAQEAVICASRVSARSAQHQLALAQTLVDDLRPTLAALSAGDFSARHADAIAETSWRLPAEVLPALQKAVLPRAGQQTLGELRRSLRRQVLLLDPDGGERREASAKRERRVELRPGDDGMSEVRTTVSSVDAQIIFDRLTSLARLFPACDERGRDEQRADLLVDAIFAGLAGRELPEHTGRRPHVNLVVHLSTLIGVDDEPGELTGHGPISAALARWIASDPSATWRRIVTDPLTGQQLDFGNKIYAPPANLAEHVRARDGECVFPHCHQPAWRCDLDHRQPSESGGPTAEHNLHALCRRHHRCKTHTKWTYQADPGGQISWRTPTGHVYSNEPPRRWPEPGRRPAVSFEKTVLFEKTGSFEKGKAAKSTELAAEAESSDGAEPVHGRPEADLPPF